MFDTIADILSAILLFAGVTITLYGILGTWKEWAPEGAGFWGPFFRFLLTPWNAARRHFQRIFGKKTPHSASGSATANLQLKMFASGYRTPGPLPAPDDLEAFAQAVNDQLREAFASTGALNARFEEEQRRARKAEKELRAQIAQADQAVDAKMRKAMTDGIHLDLGGVLLVFISGVFQVLKLIF